MSSDSGGQVCKGVELLDLTRPRDRQQSFDGAFALFAAGAKHDLPPLHGGPERALGGRMPRAGLCRVGLSRTPLLGADLSIGFFGVSA